jgi:hypothetical protein
MVKLYSKLEKQSVPVLLAASILDSSEAKRLGASRFGR